MAVRLDFVLSRGVAEGVITSEQAERLRSLAVGVPEPARGEQPAVSPPTTEAPSLVTEALGYLGGIIILVGAILVGSQFWEELGAGARLATVLVAAAVLLIAGALVPEGLGPVGTRLRAVLWALSVVTVTGAAGILFYDVIDSDANHVPTLMASLATLYALALWIWRPSVLQLAMAAIGTAVTVGLVLGLLDLDFEFALVGVVGVGAVWLLLGWFAVVKPPRATMVIGAAIAFAGSQMFVVGGQGPIWGVLTAAGLVGVALRRRDLLILGIGALGLLFSLPNLIYEWFPSVAAAALSLLVVGGLLVTAAIYTARRKGPRAGTAGGPPTAGTDKRG